MSDKLSNLLYSTQNLIPTKKEDPDQKLINALEKALKATTPERAGCPWDIDEEEDEQRSPGYWFPEGD